VREKAPLGQLATGGFIDAIIRPVRLVVDEPFLVVNQWVEQHQTPHLIREPRGKQSTDPTAEARPDHVNRLAPRDLPDVGNRRPDVIDDPRQGQLLLATVALPVPAKVEPKRCHTALGEPIRLPTEEPTLVPAHPTTMDQHCRPT
jgi:hypothetical protein